jgi:type I restriction enzyme, S subunit
MKLETFFEKFDQFADAPDAVAKMRELVLEFAVRGLLSERNAKDQTESAWVEFIEEFDNRIYGSDPGPPPPLEIPDEWRWVCLDDLGKTKVRNDVADGARVAFTPMALIPAGYGLPAQSEERTWSEVKKGFTHFADGDVVMAKITPCFENGKSAVMRKLLNGVGAGTTELHVFRRGTEAVLPEFVLIYLKTRGFITRGEPRMTGSAGQKRVPHDYFAGSPFPLPPPAEQKRIVAKVDELMALCDRLEAQQLARETRHAALARASLARFADAPTPANLPFLFHPSYAIPPADLRKSILTLAVQGKLVRFEAENDAQTVGDHIEFQNGYAFKSQWFKPDGMRLCRNVNVSHGVVDWRESAFVDDDVAKEFERFALREGDIVLSLDRPLITTGLKVARIRKSDLPCLLLQRVAKPVPKHDQLDMSYFLLWLNSSEFVDSIDPGRSNGVPHISTRQVQLLPFVLPPLVEQRRIVAKVDQLMALVDALETQLATSRATAANLLSALVDELTPPPARSCPATPAPADAGGQPFRFATT